MLNILCAHCPPFSSILTMSLPPTRFFIPMKGSVWVGTTPAATSMPTTAIEDNCHDNEHNTRALSNSSNCAHSTSCANPTPLNDPKRNLSVTFSVTTCPITLTLTFVKPFGFLQFLLGQLFQVLRIVSAHCRISNFYSDNYSRFWGLWVHTVVSPIFTRTNSRFWGLWVHTVVWLFCSVRSWSYLLGILSQVRNHALN